MLNSQLIEAENLYRRPLSLEEETSMIEKCFIEKYFVDRENWEEHYVKKGDPTKPTYFIIRSNRPNNGLFAEFHAFIAHIRYALTNQWIPVIDMQNYPNAYLDPEKLGKENAWEYYFEQPFRIGLEEAYSGENIILSAPLPPKPDYIVPWHLKFMFIYRNIEELSEWRMLHKLGFVKVKPEIMQEASATHDKLFPPKERVLGVFLRGTDYTSLKLYGHPIPPPCEHSISMTINKMKEWKCTKVFLSTEDKTLVDIFKESFGDYCFVSGRELPDYNPEKAKYITSTLIDRENDRFLQGKGYLIDMLLLSMCNSYVCSGGAGSDAPIFFNQNIENAYSFGLGHYGVYPKYKP